MEPVRGNFALVRVVVIMTVLNVLTTVTCPDCANCVREKLHTSAVDRVRRVTSEVRSGGPACEHCSHVPLGAVFDGAIDNTKAAFPDSNAPVCGVAVSPITNGGLNDSG